MCIHIYVWVCVYGCVCRLYTNIEQTSFTSSTHACAPPVPPVSCTRTYIFCVYVCVFVFMCVYVCICVCYSGLGHFLLTFFSIHKLRRTQLRQNQILYGWVSSDAAVVIVVPTTTATGVTYSMYL